MLSRAAEAIYWMSRYIERAENVARIIEVNLNLVLDLPASSAGDWRPLVTTSGDHARFDELYDAATADNVIRFLTFDRRNPNSILSCLAAARDNARGVREVIAREMWEQLNTFCLLVRQDSRGESVRESPHEFFSAVRMAGHLFAGITDACMSQGEEWHFCRLGRFIERADKTTRILDVKYFILLPSVADVGTTIDDMQWAALLRSVSAFQMYRQRHGRITPERVVEFLLLDRLFPRAVLHCLAQAEQSLHAISGSSLETFSNPAEQRIGQLRSNLTFARAADLIAGGLHEYLDDLERRLNLVGDAVSETFFAPRPVSGAADAPRSQTSDVLSGYQVAGGTRGDRRYAGHLGQ
ncbi:MAG: alpha-E domain-containing protein [Phycisphaerae bacterium]|jgi:uncharacterized alpha-E superfamily protein